MRKPNGIILWQGASLIDGKPIVVIATGINRASRNSKTGSMIQTFIIRSDIRPTDALKTGDDRSVCGDCSKRPAIHVSKGKGDRPCYVNVGRSVNAVYAAFVRGAYPEVPLARAREAFSGRVLRLGSYGNSSAAPFEVWAEAAADCAGHTGYIHNWRSADPRWRELVMASVESFAEALEARKLGYRLFRVRLPGESLIHREIACPASKEAGHRTTCFQCLACGGTSSKAKVDIAIFAH